MPHSHKMLHTLFGSSKVRVIFFFFAPLGGAAAPACHLYKSKELISLSQVRLGTVERSLTTGNKAKQKETKTKKLQYLYLSIYKDAKIEIRIAGACGL